MKTWKSLALTLLRSRSRSSETNATRPADIHFPPIDICPVCGTNDDGRCVLIPIDGTGRDGIVESKCVHLACAVATNLNANVGVIYRELKK